MWAALSLNNTTKQQVGNFNQRYISSPAFLIVSAWAFGFQGFLLDKVGVSVDSEPGWKRACRLAT
jgi:hypothetical protein